MALQTEAAVKILAAKTALIAARPHLQGVAASAADMLLSLLDSDEALGGAIRYASVPSGRIPQAGTYSTTYASVPLVQTSLEETYLSAPAMSNANEISEQVLP